MAQADLHKKRDTSDDCKTGARMFDKAKLLKKSSYMSSSKVAPAYRHIYTANSKADKRT